MRANERKALVCLRESLYGMGAAASTAVYQPCLFNGNMPPSQQTVVSAEIIGVGGQKLLVS